MKIRNSSLSPRWFVGVGLIVFVFNFFCDQAKGQTEMEKALKDLTQLLDLFDVQADLELTADQLTDFRKLKSKFYFKSAALEQRYRESEDNTQRRSIESEMDSELALFKTELGEILLPHQMQRLSQLQLQTKLKSQGQFIYDGSFGVLALKRQLDLTNSQIEKIDEVIKENNARFREELKTIGPRFLQHRNEYRPKALALLTERQRQEFEELMGAERIERTWISFWLDLCEKDRDFILRGTGLYEGKTKSNR